jgi:CheY-like chemotaxis protein
MELELERQPKSRILAIEPDPARAATLRRLIRGHVSADFEIVNSCSEAMEAIGKRVPDLVLTSTFLPPAEEAALTDSLKQLSDAAHVQLITVPHFIDFEDSRESRPGVLNFLRRRAALIRPVCDPRTVREQIEHYLEKARVEKIEASERQTWDELRTQSTSLMRLDGASARRLTAGDVCTLAEGVGAARAHKLGSLHAEDRRRASRRPLVDIPWLKSARLPWGLEVGVVNVSTSGILLESNSKITTGTTVDLQLIGRGLTGVNVPARLIRSEVGAVNSMGVKYRVAAAFDRELDLGVEVAQQVSATTATPKALANILVQALSDITINSRSAAPRARFEQGLRQLMTLREVQLRPAPVAPADQDDSVYFKVPQESGVSAVLQVVFEHGHQPSASDFKLLKAAAGVAGVVLEFAPLQETA